MEWRAAPVMLSALKGLGHSSEGENWSSHFSLPRLSASDASSFKDLLAVPLNRSVWPPVSMATFPTSGQLDRCIDLYFLHFDKVG